MDTDKIIQSLRNMAQENKTPAEMLRYMVLDLAIEQQIDLMKNFAEAFDLTLGEVTAISGWWHDDTAELNDNDINVYMMPALKSYLEAQS
jgi:hypothetical protein